MSNRKNLGLIRFELNFNLMEEAGFYYLSNDTGRRVSGKFPTLRALTDAMIGANNVLESSSVSYGNPFAVSRSLNAREPEGSNPIMVGN